MTKFRRRTTCTVPGHGTRCPPSRERDNDYPRPTEERMALEYEAAADNVRPCPHRWRTAERGQGHEHWCGELIQDGVPHECRCCCGLIDLDQWDLPARKTPHLRRRKAA